MRQVSPTIARLCRWVWSLRSAYLGSQDRHFRILVGVQVAYFLLLFAVLILTQNWPTPDQIGIALFLFALITARPLRFLRDWFPFIFLVLSYEALRGLSDGLAGDAHIGFPIMVDSQLFGTIPTVYLQDHLWDPNHLHWYDYVAAFVHPLHFILPLALAFVLWMWSPRHYWRFVGSYLLLTYAGLVTYVLYPMAPPWYASDLGRIPHIETILGQVLWQHSASHPVVFIYDKFDPNPVAAMPSLHAAFPVLVFLVCLRLRPKWGWLSIVYPILMDFSVVYLGEHYVVDVIAGTLYGAAAYYTVWVLPDRWSRFRTRSQPVPVAAHRPPSGLPEPG
jgi:membrane-associated phospholipid phosphatase